MLSDARPGFMAGVVGKGLFLPFYNFKQEEKPNVSVLHFPRPIFTSTLCTKLKFRVAVTSACLRS